MKTTSDSKQSGAAGPDWTRARGLLVELKSAVRRSLSAQVLLGKELFGLKRRLGYLGKGANRGPEGQFVVTGKSWDQICREELGICSKTADRWIDCYDVALTRAKARKAKEPEAARLLMIPAAELTGDELEGLAACVDRLVKHDTQADLLYELGILKDTRLEGGDTSAFRKDGTDAVDIEAEASSFFKGLCIDTAKIERFAGRLRASENFQPFLYALPLSHPEPTRVICLMDLKARLEEVLGGDLDKLLVEVSKAIEAKMHGNAPKRIRRKSRPARLK